MDVSRCVSIGLSACRGRRASLPVDRTVILGPILTISRPGSRRRRVEAECYNIYIRNTYFVAVFLVLWNSLAGRGRKEMLMRKKVTIATGLGAGSAGRCARSAFLAGLLCLTSTVLPAGATTKTMSPQVKAFIKIDAPVFALTHVRVIDGTGGPVLEDQTVVVADGKINTVGAASSVAVPAGALVRDCTGYTVIPGLVGMHDHIIYPAGGGHYNTLLYSAPRLYLAGGVTTIRTTGGNEIFSELNLKKAINEGRVPGPRMHVTSPFLEGKGSYTLDMRELSGPDDARAMVRFWAEQGVDDIKAYMDVSRAELKAIIDEAHKRGLKVAGHLGAVGFREAARTRHRFPGARPVRGLGVRRRQDPR